MFVAMRIIITLCKIQVYLPATGVRPRRQHYSLKRLALTAEGGGGRGLDHTHVILQPGECHALLVRHGVGAADLPSPGRTGAVLTSAGPM